MALENVKRDNNVPFIGPKSRYNVLGVNPTWIYQDMASAAFSKATPKVADTPEDEDSDPDVAEPTISPGKADYTNLVEGGIFNMISNRNSAVEVLDTDGSATLEIHDKDALKTELEGGAASSPIRTTPSTPFLLGASEVLVAIGDAGGRFGVLVKIQGDKIL